MHAHTTPRARRGLTLLELMIVLVIVAVLATLAVPSMGRRLAAQRAISAAETLAADIAEARYEAARRGLPLHVLPQPGPAWCWVVSTTPSCSCAAPNGSCALKVVHERDHPGVTLASAKAVSLDAHGQAQAAHAADFTASHAQVRVMLSTFGRARLCDAGGTLPKLSPC
jgi:prepilin-type N-terminal cleavage/methylation domain-containing protein